MDQNYIISVIQSCPEMSYGELKKHASEAGIPKEELKAAWGVVRGNNKDHDRRVDRIRREVISAEKGIKTRNDFKRELVRKGFSNDEIDLGYSLAEAKFNELPTRKDLVKMWPVLVSACLLSFAIPIGIFGSMSIFSAILGLVFVAIVIYIDHIIVERAKMMNKVLMTDFDAGSLSEKKSHELRKTWIQHGGTILDRGKYHKLKLHQTVYDGRETYFGNYSYTMLEAGSSHTFTFFLVAQRHKKQFPPVQCYKVIRGLADHPFAPRSVSGEEHVELEGAEFSQAYNLMANSQGTDATYVFNPRVMNAFLGEKARDQIVFFETAGDMILMGFEELKMHGNLFRFQSPIVRYDEYMKIKSRLICYLDITTDINDILEYEMADDGEDRSVAEEGQEE